MNRRGLIYGILLLWLPSILSGQSQDPNIKNQIIETRIEQLDTEDAEIDYTTLFETLQSYYENPLNLNNCTASELQDLYLLNDIQISALLQHIEKNGKLLNIYELQTIDGFDAHTIQSILPFVKIAGKIDQSQFNMARAMQDGKSAIFFRYIRTLEEQKGFSDIDPAALADHPNKRFLGSPDRLYMRYRFKYLKHVSLGITAEKDQGEEFFKGSQKNGFDFYSAHFAIADYGKIKNVVVGDYHVQLGQGLTFWTGQAFGKSIDLLSIKKNARGLKPYTSVDENRFMRGAATTLQFGNIDVSLAASYKKIDANLKPDTIHNIDNIFSSFQQTGIHATPAELIDKDAIHERILVGNVQYRKGLFSIGTTIANTSYQGDFQRNLGIYNQFESSANSTLKLGVDYNWTYNNMNLFGEVSKGIHGGLGYLQGMLISLDRNLTAVALYRHYDRDFFPNNAVGISENSKNINETGLLLGAQSKLGRHWSMDLYVDQFQFPWLKYQVDAPSSGYESVVQLKWKPKRGTEIYFRYRHRDKQRNSKDDSPLHTLTQAVQNNYRIHFSSKVTQSIRLKSRVEWTHYTLGQERERGFIAYQDLTYKALSFPFSFSIRYALFDTDSYNTRIYAYESDVLYYFSIPAYAHIGSRYYLSTKYRVNRKLDLWLRWSQWLYTNRQTVGSGLNEIDGHTKSEVKFQLRYKF